MEEKEHWSWKKVREREREKHTVDHSKIFLKAIDQKNEALIIMRFYNLLSSKTGVLEIHTVVSFEPSGCCSAFVEENRNPGADIVIFHTVEETIPSSWNASGKDGIASLGTKELVAAIMLPPPLRRYLFPNAENDILLCLLQTPNS